MPWSRASSTPITWWVGLIASPGAARTVAGLVHLAHELEPGEDRHPSQTLTVAHQELPANILGVIPKAEMWRALRLFNNDWGMRLVNAAKYQAGRLEANRRPYLQSHGGFSFLLDYVPNWKWAYGRAPVRQGLIQYQSFVPHTTALETYRALMELNRAHGLTPYLGVLKRHRPDPFWLTHAVDGWSFAMDFRVTPAKPPSAVEPLRGPDRDRARGGRGGSTSPRTR